jgi:hypothetical protein
VIEMESRTQLVEIGRHWVPPAGLDRSRPRDVRLTARGIVLLVLSGILCLGAIAAGLGLAAIANREAQEALLFEKEGQMADGLIIRLWRGRDKERQPWASYRFEVQGQTYEGSTEVPLQIWRNLRVGSSFSVRYVPSRPNLSHLLGLAPRPLPPWVPIPVSGGLALGGFLVTLPVRSQRRLLAYGRTAPALVTAHGKKERTRHGSDLGVQFTYEFPLLSGAIAKGGSGPSKNPPAIESLIPVLYDPDGPSRNAPYPLSLLKLASR